MFTYSVYVRRVMHHDSYDDVVTDYGDVLRVEGMRVKPNQCLEVTVQGTRVLSVRLASK